MGTGPAPDPQPPPSATTWNRESTVLEAGALGSVPAHSFIHSFSKCLLRTYYVPGTLQSTGDAAGHKTDKVPAPWSLHACGEDC